MSRSLLNDWEYDIRKCCKEDIPMEMMDIAEDIYSTAYQSGVTEVLDKIRAEIERLPITDTAVRLVTEILDKYKAESEEQTDENDK